jgi:hypothetical protein
MNRALAVSVGLLVLSVLSRGAEAPDKKQTELFETIARLDSEIFGAFNKHDVTRLMSLLRTEFYCTPAALEIRENAEAFTKMFASTPDIRRDLSRSPVYPVKDYGAMEIGRHRFATRRMAQGECAWLRDGLAEDGRLAEDCAVWSYGHQPSRPARPPRRV